MTAQRQLSPRPATEKTARDSLGESSRSWWGYVAGLAASTALALASASALAHDPPQGLAAVAAPVLPSVVNITIWAPSDAATPLGPDGKKPDRTQFFGSGFVIDPSGLIVTNEHVIHNAVSIAIRFRDGRSMPGTLVAANSGIDLAVVRVKTPQPLPALQFGDSNQLQIGDPVLAIGNPLGIGLSVSAGIVSALNRNISDSPYGNSIQTDAAINHGNSGGPLVDMQGRVIGVDSSIFTLQGSGSIGLGFAIPSDDVKFVVDRLLKYGEVRAGWIGVSVQDVGPDIALALHLSTQHGLILADVTAASPAARAKLEEGDIVEKVGDVVPQDAGAVMRAIAETPIDQTIPIVIWRRGNEMTVPVTVSTYPADVRSQVNLAGGSSASSAGAAAAPENYGMHLLAITPELSQKYGFSADQQGIAVDAVDRNSTASESGINPGNIVLRAMDMPVSTPEEFSQAMSHAKELGLPFVAMLVRSHTGQRWIAIPNAN